MVRLEQLLECFPFSPFQIFHKLRRLNINTIHQIPILNFALHPLSETPVHRITYKNKYYFTKSK